MVENHQQVQSDYVEQIHELEEKSKIFQEQIWHLQ